MVSNGYGGSHNSRSIHPRRRKMHSVDIRNTGAHIRNNYTVSSSCSHTMDPSNQHNRDRSNRRSAKSQNHNTTDHSSHNQTMGDKIY